MCVLNFEDLDDVVDGCPWSFYNPKKNFFFQFENLMIASYPTKLWAYVFMDI